MAAQRNGHFAASFARTGTLCWLILQTQGNNAAPRNMIVAPLPGISHTAISTEIGDQRPHVFSQNLPTLVKFAVFERQAVDASAVFGRAPTENLRAKRKIRYAASAELAASVLQR